MEILENRLLLSSVQNLSDLNAAPGSGEQTVVFHTSADTTAPGSVTALTATAGDARVDLNWSNPAASDFAGVLILRTTGGDPNTAPTPGQTYYAGQTIGNATVLFANNGTSFSNTANVSNGSNYRYSIFAYDTSMNYSPVVAVNATPTAGLFFNCDQNGKLYTLNMTTGAVQTIGSMGVVMWDIAMSPTGQLYGLDGTSSLYLINKSTAAVSLIGPVGGYVNALAFSPTGTLYAAGTQFFTLNTSTGLGTPIGNLSGLTSAGDLAIDSSGKIFLTTTANTLVQINPATGNATNIGAIGFNQIYGLGFGSNGTLYGVSNSDALAISINTTTGQGTQVSNFLNGGVNGSNGMTSYVVSPAPIILVSANGHAIADDQITPSSINGTDFGALQQGGSVVDVVYTISNNGAAVLNIGDISIPAGFTLLSGPASSVAIGGNTSFTVRLPSSALGTFSGTINIPTNDPANGYYSFTITGNVNRMNHAPSGANKAISTFEDSTYTFTTADFGFTDPNDNPADIFAAVKISTLPAKGILSNNGTPVISGQSILVSDILAGKLVYAPAANGNGINYTSFTFQVQDNGGTSNGGIDTDPTANSIFVNITAVNDAPSFSKGADQIFNEDSAAKTIANWATAISTGPADEAGQSPTFLVNNDNNKIFAVGPAIAADGTLTFTPAANANGSATITVSLKDSGGTANGGIDTSASQTFTITITSVNDAPIGADKTAALLEDATYTFATGDFGFTDPNDNPANNFASVKITTLPAAGVLSNNGTPVTAGQFIPVADILAGLLSYSPVANGNGNSYSSFAFQVQDDGGSANGGSNIDASPNRITFNVITVNDAPSFTKGADQVINEDAAAQTINNWASTISAGPSDEISQLLTFVVNNDNNSLFAIEPSIAANGTLTFTPAANANGSTTVTVFLKDNGGTANSGIDTSASQTFTITINPTNDAPSGANNTVTLAEDSSYIFAVSDFGFSDPNDIPANNFSSVKISTLPAHGVLYDNQTAVTTGQFIPIADILAGQLSFIPAANDNGSNYASFSFQVRDDGGTSNGGIDTDPTANTLTVNVTAVNNAPVNHVPTASQPMLNTNSLVFSAAHQNAISISDIDAGNSAVKVTLATDHGVLTLSTTNGLTFDVNGGDGTNDASMTFTGTIAAINTALNGAYFTSNAGFVGSSSVTITTDDQGNTGSGGAKQVNDTVNIAVEIAINSNKGKVSYTDSQGHLVNVVLTGPGSFYVGLMGTNNVDANEIKLTGTTEKSALTITTSAGTFTNVNNIWIGDSDSPGSLLSLTASTTNLSGHLLASGTLGTITMRDLLNGANLTYSGTATKTLAMTFQNIGENSTISTTAAIGAFKASNVALGSQIIAPSIATLTTTAMATRALPGDFGADLQLSGVGIKAPLYVTLGATNIAGSLSGGTWNINTGNVSAVSVGDMNSNWTGNIAGALTSLTSKAGISGKLTAGKIGAITAKTSISNAQILSTGNIGAVSAATMINSSLYAGVTTTNSALPTSASQFTTDSSIASLTIKGLTTSPNADAFVNSNVAAATLTLVNIKNAQLSNNGTPFGVAAKTIKALSLTQGTKKYTWSPTTNAKWILNPVDLVALDL